MRVSATEEKGRIELMYSGVRGTAEEAMIWSRDRKRVRSSSVSLNLDAETKLRLRRQFRLRVARRIRVPGLRSYPPEDLRWLSPSPG